MLIGRQNLFHSIRKLAAGSGRRWISAYPLFSAPIVKEARKPSGHQAMMPTDDQHDIRRACEFIELPL